MFLQIMIYVWTSDKVSTAVRVTLTVASVYAVVPVVQLGPFQRAWQFVFQKAKPQDLENRESKEIIPDSGIECNNPEQWP